MLLPVALLLVSSSGWLTMVSIAVDDPGFSVERDYYKKASAFDVELSQRSHNAALGWKVRVVEATLDHMGQGAVVIAITDPRHEHLDELSVSAEAFAVARGADVRHVALTPLGRGIHRLQMERVRPGLWDVRIEARRGAVVFTQTLRLEFEVREALPS